VYSTFFVGVVPDHTQSTSVPVSQPSGQQESEVTPSQPVALQQSVSLPGLQNPAQQPFGPEVSHPSCSQQSKSPSGLQWDGQHWSA
jgi:hypothetical protein